MEEAFLAAVKQAFYEANVNHDCVFEYTPTTTAAAMFPVSQCIVRYESGNEYIRLDTLINSLGKFGTVSLIEYRGRGHNDDNQLVFEFKFYGVIHQVIYILPQS